MPWPTLLKLAALINLSKTIESMGVKDLGPGTQEEWFWAESDLTSSPAQQFRVGREKQPEHGPRLTLQRNHRLVLAGPSYTRPTASFLSHAVFPTLYFADSWSVHRNVCAIFDE